MYPVVQNVSLAFVFENWRHGKQYTASFIFEYSSQRNVFNQFGWNDLPLACFGKECPSNRWSIFDPPFGLISGGISLTLSVTLDDVLDSLVSLPVLS